MFIELDRMIPISESFGPENSFSKNFSIGTRELDYIYTIAVFAKDVMGSINMTSTEILIRLPGIPEFTDALEVYSATDLIDRLLDFFQVYENQAMT